MKKALFRKSMATVLLVLVLTFSMFSTCIFVAQAEESEPTIGKYLTIDFSGSDAGIADSSCSVRATKSSGLTFVFEPNPELDDEEQVIEQRVGAGTVYLEAIAGNGWIFDSWSDNVEPDPLEPTGYYKTEKLAIVSAKFVRAYTITTIVYGDVGGTIEPPGPIFVEAGDTPEFTFDPLEGYHVSLIQVRSLLTNRFFPSDDSYTFFPVDDDYELVVYFSEDGTAFIPPEASGVDISLGDPVNQVNLRFESLTAGGTATQFEILSVGDFIVGGSSLILWNIEVEDVEFTNAIVSLPYSGDPPITHIYTSNDITALYCDVNGDGEVTTADVNKVAIALATSGREYDATYDVNMDLALDSADIQLVHDYIGTQLEELSWTYDPDLQILYIETGHFSIFRGR
jgi:hypothetical protein